MKIYFGFEQVPILQNTVVTTGSFDGVHIGHQAIINRIKTLATTIHGESVIITFHPHPRKVLYPQTAGKDLHLINTLEEKIELLREAGIDHLVVVEFTLDFAKITAEEFAVDYLHHKLGCSIAVVGFNHHFGHNRLGDYNYLHKIGIKYGMAVEEIPELDLQQETISSTKIRKAIIEGNIQRANAYLNHHYFITAQTKLIENQNELAGYSKYSLFINNEDKLLPPKGIYAISVNNSTEKSVKGLVQIKETDNPLQELYVFTKENLQNGLNKFYFYKRLAVNVASLEEAAKSIDTLIY
jgi:riboflavin kinase / FMN adenylyltransferase